MEVVYDLLWIEQNKKMLGEIRQGISEISASTASG